MSTPEAPVAFDPTTTVAAALTALPASPATTTAPGSARGECDGNALVVRGPNTCEMQLIVTYMTPYSMVYRLFLESSKRRLPGKVVLAQLIERDINVHRQVYNRTLANLSDHAPLVRVTLEHQTLVAMPVCDDHVHPHYRIPFIVEIVDIQLYTAPMSD
jgi:hypothetical protein